MTKWQKFKHKAYLYFRYDLWESLRNLRRRVWNKHLKMWWGKLFVRKDEFHKSLDMDPEALMVMNKKELREYYQDLAKRRAIAHERQLAREDAEAGS